MCGLYATASACLFTLLLNTYHSNKMMLNTGADKDEKHGRHIFLFSGSWEELFGVGGEWTEENLKRLEMTISVAPR